MVWVQENIRLLKAIDWENRATISGRVTLSWMDLGCSSDGDRFQLLVPISKPNIKKSISTMAKYHFYFNFACCCWNSHHHRLAGLKEKAKQC